MKNTQDNIEKDESITRVMVGFGGLAVITCLAVGFNDTSILWGLAFIPNWIDAICNTKN